MKQKLQKQQKNNPTLYFTNFYLFSPTDASLLCNYKYFIQNIIMKLGEDWRIQSSLLAQEIIANRAKSHPDQDFSDFNLFNQFLSAFLKNKIGKEYEYTSFTESHIEQQFLETVNSSFSQENSSLTFKTLSIGYCVTATQVWNKTFKNPINKHSKQLFDFRPFGKVVKRVLIDTEIKNENQSIFEASSVRRKIQNIDLVSKESMSEMGNISDKKEIKDRLTVQWQEIQEKELQSEQIANLKQHLHKIKNKLNKTQILSHFVCYIDEVHLKSGRNVRVFSLSNEFYLNAFIIWLIFNIKMFFSLSFNDYIRFFKDLIAENWKSQYERPLKKFQLIVERQWNKLLKDYTVALHDDIEVLNILVNRIRKQIQTEWEQKLSGLKKTFIA